MTVVCALGLAYRELRKYLPDYQTSFDPSLCCLTATFLVAMSL